MTIDEKEGLGNIYGSYEVLAEWITENNVFDFVHFTDEDGEEGLFNLSSWEEVEVDFNGLVQK